MKIIFLEHQTSLVLSSHRRIMLTYSLTSVQINPENNYWKNFHLIIFNLKKKENKKITF